MRQAAGGSDPQTPVARSQERRDADAWQCISGRRGPIHETHAVEPYETGFRSDPQVAVCGLHSNMGGSGEVSLCEIWRAGSSARATLAATNSKAKR